MKVLVIDSFPEKFLNELHALPVTVTYVPKAQRAEILPLLADAEILVINSKIKVDREAADAAPKLRMVIRAGVGMDHIDMEYLASKGVVATFTAGANADAVGEQTVGMLLALRNNLLRADRQVRQFQWLREANRGIEIGGKTVGVIGYGHTGKASSWRLAGMRCKVLAYDKYLSDYSDTYVQQATMEEIYDKADILTLHIPLNPETRYLVNDDFIARFRKPFVLLNLARGPIVELAALLRALDSGKVTAAALDVLENEKLDTLTDRQRSEYENLFARENVILSPHIGGWTVESLNNINSRIIELIAAELDA